MDPFSQLGLPLRLAIESGVLEEALRDLAKSAHPDAGGDAQRFAEIRRAGDLLKSPVSRLRAALELSGVEVTERGTIPSAIMDYFSPVAGVLEDLGEFLSEREKAKSHLGKAILDAKVPDLKGRLESLTESLTEIEKGELEKFSEFDDRGWDHCFEEMEETFRALLFVHKWLEQLREAQGKIFEALLAG